MFLKKLKNLSSIRTFTKNVFRIQSNNSIMCRYCIGFIDFIFGGKTLIDFTSLLPPDDFEKKWQYNL